MQDLYPLQKEKENEEAKKGSGAGVTTHFLIEIMFILNAIKSHFKRVVISYEMTTRVGSSMLEEMIFSSIIACQEACLKKKQDDISYILFNNVICKNAR